MMFLPSRVKSGLAALALAAVGSLWPLAAAAQSAPLRPPVQAELDAAVIAYESGRHVQAQKAFEALSRRSVAAADFNLAVMHLRGEVPQASVARAEALMTRAARSGFVTAQVMLAQGLETSVFGRRDLQQAHQWYEVAAESGSVEAQVAMGTAFYLGRGRAKDASRAAHWFREAAKGGDVGAMYLLASMYEYGDGLDRDLRLARYWYELAARNGDEAAPDKVKELDARAARL